MKNCFIKYCQILSISVFCSLFGIANEDLSFANIPDDSSSKDGGTLIVGVSIDVDTFNPLFSESLISQEINHLLFVGLADLNDKSEFEGELATKWESSDDNLSLIYHLRKDAIWSDGVPITAEDVKFTFDLLMDTTVASPRYGETEYIKRVEVIDNYTIKFEFTEAYPAQVFDTAGEILPKHVLQSADRKELLHHEFGRNPISSGPFVLKKWVSQQYVELVPNEKYFGKKPYLSRVIFKIVPDKTNLLLQLQTGEIDMMVGVPPEEVGQLQTTNPTVKIYPISGRVYYYVGYNEENSLFESVDARKAITMAIDRQIIIDALLFGYGTPCKGPIPPMLKWAYNNEVKEFPYDPEQSKQLLATIGWKDSDNDGLLDKEGRNFEFTLKTNTGNQLRSDVAIIIQDQLKKVGIKVNIQTVEWSALMGDLHEGDFEAYMGGWSTSYNVDPTPIFHSSATTMFNFINYSNSAIDKLIETGREEMNQQKAAKIWKEFQEKIYLDQPYTFLFWVDRIVAVNSRFQNVTPIALSAYYNLENWYESKTLGVLKK